MGWKLLAEKILEADISAGQRSVVVNVRGKFHDPLPGQVPRYDGYKLEWPRADCVVVYPCGRLVPAPPPQSLVSDDVSLHTMPAWQFRMTEHIPLQPGNYNVCVSSQTGETPGWQKIQIQ